MTKEFSTTIVKRKGSHGYNAMLPFEFDAKEKDTVAIPSKVHLIPIGQWEHDLYGPIIINAADIREYQQNFNAGVRKGVFITAGHEGFMELPAVGWITEVESRDTGLWGTVEWNELGKETLNDKQFKYFSPEMYRDYEDPQSHQFFRNVLTGGALTKSPYFKELEAVVFSDRNIKSNFEESKIMTKTLDEVLAIEDVATLTDEEKTLLKDNKETLTDEQKTKFAPVLEVAEAPVVETPATPEAPAPEETPVVEPEKIEASDKKLVQITASELAILTDKANKGAEAMKKIEASELSSAVETLVFSEKNKAGAFLPKSKDTLRAFMETLNEVQKTKFSSLMKELPKNQIFTEVGAGAGAIEGTAKAEMEAKINEKISASEKAGSKMSYSEALKEVMSENKELSDRYDEELRG